MTKCTKCSHERANHYWNGRIGAKCGYTEPVMGHPSYCKCPGYDPIIHEVKDEPRKCIADYIKSYINIGLKRLGEEFQFQGNAQIELTECVNLLYHNIRGEIYLNGKNPRVVAALLIYLAVEQCGIIGRNRRISVNKNDVAKALNVSHAAIKTSRLVEIGKLCHL